MSTDEEICSAFLHVCGLPGWVTGKESGCNAGDVGDKGSIPGVGKMPWRRARQPAPVCLPGESHGPSGGWRATVHGVAESDTTEMTKTQSLYTEHVSM